MQQKAVKNAIKNAIKNAMTRCKADCNKECDQECNTEGKKECNKERSQKLDVWAFTRTLLQQKGRILSDITLQYFVEVFDWII